MVYAQGTSTGTGTSAGWVQGSGNEPGHMVTFRTTTTNYTDAALAAEPPGKRFNGAKLIIAGLLVGVVGGAVDFLVVLNGLAFLHVPKGPPGMFDLIVSVSGALGLVLVAIGVPVAASDSHYNRGVLPEVYARWSRTWQCQRCGARVVI